MCSPTEPTVAPRGADLPPPAAGDPVAADITPEQLARIIGGVATRSAKLAKPLSARLLPVAGAKTGDCTTFDDPNLLNTVIQPLP
jgi:hypothetical protein